MTANPGEPETTAPDTQRRGRVPADTLANRLMLARKLAGLSIRDAAELCDLGRGAWTKWENGARPLDYLENTGVIADRLDVDLHWLRFGGPLEDARGREVRRPAKRVKSVRVTYPPRPVRLMGQGPNVRGDQRGHAVHSGQSRRPVRVNPVQSAEAVHTA